jgi:hypothetical protein
MTNQEILEAHRRHQRLSERSKTIVQDMRSTVPLEDIPQLVQDAAEVIEWLQEQNARLRKDLDEEIREGQQGARDAYTEGKLDAADESGGW